MRRPIGVIDSGVGGLTVVQELMRQLPREDLIYLGDTKRCPYGPRSEEEIISFTWEMVRFLLTKKIKMLVIACNTATAFALHELQTSLDIPVIGVIQPGARAAIKSSQNNHIAVIGTKGTIRSQAYPKALKKINPELSIDSLACPLFVPMVEQGILAGEQAENIIAKSLTPLNDTGMDTLILGCTHYPLLKETIQPIVGDNVALISSSEETARETSVILEMKQLLNHENEVAHYQFYATGETEVFEQIIQTIFGSHINELKTAVIEKVTI